MSASLQKVVRSRPGTATTRRKPQAVVGEQHQRLARCAPRPQSAAAGNTSCRSEALNNTENINEQRPQSAADLQRRVNQLEAMLDLQRDEYHARVDRWDQIISQNTKIQSNLAQLQSLEDYVAAEEQKEKNCNNVLKDEEGPILFQGAERPASAIYHRPPNNWLTTNGQTGTQQQFSKQKPKSAACLANNKSSNNKRSFSGRKMKRGPLISLSTNGQQSFLSKDGLNHPIVMAQQQQQQALLSPIISSADVHMQFSEKENVLPGGELVTPSKPSKISKKKRGSMPSSDESSSATKKITNTINNIETSNDNNINFNNINSEKKTKIDSLADAELSSAQEIMVEGTHASPNHSDAKLGRKSTERKEGIYYYYDICLRWCYVICGNIIIIIIIVISTASRIY